MHFTNIIYQLSCINKKPRIITCLCPNANSIASQRLLQGTLLCLNQNLQETPRNLLKNPTTLKNKNTFQNGCFMLEKQVPQELKGLHQKHGKEPLPEASQTRSKEEEEEVVQLESPNKWVQWRARKERKKMVCSKFQSKSTSYGMQGEKVERKMVSSLGFSEFQQLRERVWKWKT